jgi:hypothetical protein
VQDGPGGDAGEQALGGGQLAGAGQGVGGADLDAAVEHPLLEDRGHEPLVEVAEPVDQVAVLGLGRHHLDGRVLLLEVAAHPDQGAAGPEAGHEVGHLGQVAPDLRPGGLVVGGDVGRVAVLVQHHPVGVVGGQLLGPGDGPVGAAGGR